MNGRRVVALALRQAGHAGLATDRTSEFLDPFVPHRAEMTRTEVRSNPNRPAPITKTERPRSANLLQMPRGLMCKLRQRGRDYGGPAGSRGIDPSLQPLPF